MCTVYIANAGLIAGNQVVKNVVTPDPTINNNLDPRDKKNTRFKIFVIIIQIIKTCEKLSYIKVCAISNTCPNLLIYTHDRGWGPC